MPDDRPRMGRPPEHPDEGAMVTTSIRLSQRHYALLDALQARYGCSASAVVRHAVAELAERIGVTLPSAPSKRRKKPPVV